MNKVRQKQKPNMTMLFLNLDIRRDNLLQDSLKEVSLSGLIKTSARTSEFILQLWIPDLLEIHIISLSLFITVKIDLFRGNGKSSCSHNIYSDNDSLAAIT